jgi:hypothetical protein
MYYNINIVSNNLIMEGKAKQFTDYMGCEKDPSIKG